MNDPHAFLGGLSPSAFVAEHWQRRPLLVRRAFDALTPPASLQDLLELSRRPEVQSRLIVGDPARGARVSYGPFSDRQLRALPQALWTLLVQDVDQYVPAARDLLSRFDFVPQWRVDDLMVSYAAPQGSVGPHVDAYDVFLIQAQGTRRWQIARKYDPTLLPDCDLRVLQHFETEQEWDLEPGDMLYLPPGVAHFGRGTDASLTLSVGFRAPDQRELLSAYAHDLLEQAQAANTSQRFEDAGRAVAQPGEALQSADLAELRRLLRTAMNGTDAGLNGFLGRYLTRPKDHLAVSPQSPEEVRSLRERLAAGQHLERRPGSRWLHDSDASEGPLTLFVDGSQYPIAAGHMVWLRPLVLGRSVGHQELRADDLPLIAQLLAQRALVWSAAASD